MAGGYLRIGEFSQRVGVSAERLRAWEKRYGLLAPARSEGGFRLYSDGDVARVRRMLAHLEHGASAAEAAGLALRAPAPNPPALGNADEGGVPLSAWVVRLRERLEDFDEAEAQATLDDLLATFTFETVMRDVVLPCLASLGERWAAGDVTVAQEHFSSNLLRGRLLSLAQGWGQGSGPRALLAAPPGELHDLGLIIGGLALWRHGLRIVHLGADCPIDTVITTVATMRPALVLMAATGAATFRDARAVLTELAVTVPLYLGGPSATHEVAEQIGATWVDDDPVSAAAWIARSALDVSPAVGRPVG